MHTVPNKTRPPFEEIGVRRCPSSEKRDIVVHAVGRLKGHNDGRGKTLHEDVLGALVFQPQEFSFEIQGLGGELLNRNDFNVVF